MFLLLLLYRFFCFTWYTDRMSVVIGTSSAMLKIFDAGMLDNRRISDYARNEDVTRFVDFPDILVGCSECVYGLPIHILTAYLCSCCVRFLVLQLNPYFDCISVCTLCMLCTFFVLVVQLKMTTNDK